MSGGTAEIHRDNDYMATGTHGGADGASVLTDSADFKSCGINADVGQYVENTTQSTGGNVTASTESTLTVDGVTWDNGDTYKVYITATKNQKISSVWTDVSRGWKADKKELSDGWRAEDVDIDDKGRKKVFGPGQPEK